MTRLTRPQTEQELMIQANKEKLYKFYGIPYDVFDDEENNSQISKDREKARILIMTGKPIPKDLEEKLLQYKKELSVTSK